MDNFCLMAARLLDWIDRTAAPPLPYVGLAHGRVMNPPAPHVELVFATQSDWHDIHVGDCTYAIRQHEIGIHSVHHGNYAEPPTPDTAHQAWCLFLDVSKASGFDDLKKKPFASAVKVTEPERMGHAFMSLHQRCTTLNPVAFAYPSGNKAYSEDTERTLAKSSRMFIKTALLELLTCILQEGERAGNPAQDMPSAVTHALDFISQHYPDGDIFLDRLAAQSGLSEDHFGRLFRKHVGMSPMRYMQALRIDKSRFLLIHTNLYIEEIARNVGFRDQFYFSRMFHRHTGLSPSDFREQARAKSST